MNALIVIAMLALSFFGPGWSSEHKSYWEWQLGRPLEGWEEARLSRGINPDGNGPLLQNPPLLRNPSFPQGPPALIDLYCTATIGGEIVCEGVPPK